MPHVSESCSEEHNCAPIIMKNCESFKLIKLCEKRSYSKPLGFVLKSEAPILILGNFFSR